MAKSIIALLAGLFMLLSLSFAARSKNKEDKSPTPSFQMMNQQMSEMQEEMAEIKSTSDPEKRQKLLSEHMKQMQSHMKLMNQMMKSMTATNSTNHNLMKGRSRQHMMSQMSSMHGAMGRMMVQMQDHMNVCPFAQGTQSE